MRRNVSSQRHGCGAYFTLVTDHTSFYERYGYEDCANRQMCEPWSVRRALIDGGADWAAEAFSDMAEKAASGPMSASVLPERESQREGHDVSRKRGDGKPQGSA